MSDFNFPPDSIDEQISLPTDGLPPAEAKLIADLHRVYHPIADSSARSLERVQALLAQREARFHRSRSAPASSRMVPPHRSTPKEHMMKPSPTLLPQRSAWRRGISALVAVAL